MGGGWFFPHVFFRPQGKRSLGPDPYDAEDAGGICRRTLEK